jgi:hypothetical protein
VLLDLVWAFARVIHKLATTVPEQKLQLIQSVTVYSWLLLFPANPGRQFLSVIRQTFATIMMRHSLTIH